MKTTWWIYATARISKHRSVVGPFESPEFAVEFLRDNGYLTRDWYKVSIQSREGRRK